MVSQHEQRNPIEVLAEEFVQRHRRGEGPTVEEYAKAHPGLSDEIQRLFPAMVAMEQVKTLVVDSSDRPIELRIDKLEKLGDYRIVREIGRGGMGIVYEAEQQSLGRLVAVKVFPQQILGDSRQLQRFRREARVAALLHHTNIVQVFGVGDQDGLSYYVMQLIRGVSLDRVIDQLADPTSGAAGSIDDTSLRSDTVETGHGSVPFTPTAAASALLGAGLDALGATDGDSSCSGSSRSTAVLSCHHPYWRRVAQMGAQVGEALQYAHTHGTLHRDIKPANLLLDPNGTVWVTDFGVAKAVTQEQLSRPGDVLGTLRYMSPEQLEGVCDARSDIYSLGLTLYELIAWRPAFSDSNENGLIHRKLEQDPTLPRKLQPGVPRDLETIVLKAIARDPKRRYQAADQLVDDLTRFLDGRPIRARRVRLAEQLWRWSRRNPAVASLSMLLVLVILSSFAAVSWKWHDADAEKRRALEENHRAESNLTLALDSMGEFLDRFESTWMAHPLDPESEKDDTSFHVAVSDRSAAILEDALVFYDQFATQNASNPRLQHDTANAHRRVGDIYQRLGEYGKAKIAYSRAIEIYEVQSRQFAQNSDLVLLTASTLNQLGRVDKILGRFEDARTQYSQARQVLKERVDDSPQFRYELAHTHSNLGSVLWHLREPAEAKHNDRLAIQFLEQLVTGHPKKTEYRLALARAYRRYHPAVTEKADGRGREWFRAEAVSIMELLVEEFPKVPDYQCELSETLATISFESLGFAGVGNYPRDQPTPESLLRRAVDLARRITEEYPEIPRYRGTLARAQKDLAWLLYTTNRPRQSEPRIVEAVVIYEELWEEFPAVKAYQFFLAMALHSHGDILRGIGRLTESRQAMERAIEQLQSYSSEKPDSAFCQGMLARQNDSLAKTLTRLGAEEEAAEATRQAKEIRASFEEMFKRE